MRRPAAELESLVEARAQIDGIDSALIALLAERAEIVDRVMVLKAEAGVGAAAPTRADAVIASVRRRAAAAGFDPSMAEAMWRVMIDGFIAREEQVLGKGGVDG